MSFEMSNIIIKNKNKNYNPRNCNRYVKAEDRITEGVRVALRKYLDFSLNNRSYVNLTENKLKNMVNELLEYCCNKNFKSISIEDVKINEESIIQEIKKAIYYGAQNSLYYKNEDVYKINFSKFRNDINLNPPRLNKTNNISENISEVENYFKDLMQ